MRTARESPGDYGPTFREVTMAFDVVEAEETEDHYVICMNRGSLLAEDESQKRTSRIGVLGP